MKNKSTIIIAILFAVVVGVITSVLTINFVLNSEKYLIRDFYLTENAVHVSPHSLRVKMDKSIDDYTLVDVRSKEEYEKEHIIGAISIPTYKDKDTPAYDEEDRIISEFSKLPKDKEIIIYCYSTPCMSGRKIGKMLAENDIYVKQLGIGWNEWRYYWTLWNHEPEWNSTNVLDYVASSSEPGIPTTRNASSSCPLGGFGC